MEKNNPLIINDELRKLSKEFSYIPDSNFKKLLIILSITDVKNKTENIIKVQKISQNLLLKSGSSIRKNVMDMVWLWRKLLDNLNKFENWIFFDSLSLFNSFRDFIISSYENIDLIIYKYNNEEHSLHYYAWNKDLDSAIVELNNNPYYKNEIKVLTWLDIDSSEKYNNVTQWWLYCKKISLPWGDDIIFSFRSKPNINSDPDDIDLDIRKATKLIQKNWIFNNLKKNIELLKAYYYDELTWAYNLKYARELFNYKKSSAIFIDITDFKNINDSYWHAVWDIILREFYQVLNKSIKDSDKIFRRSWDEFFILVSSLNENVVKEVENRIHTCIENTDFSLTLCKICDKFWKCDIKCDKNKKFNRLRVKTWYHVFKYSERPDLDSLLNKADDNMMSKESETWMLSRIVKALEFIKSWFSLKYLSKLVIDKISNLEILDELSEYINERKSEINKKEEA